MSDLNLYFKAMGIGMAIAAPVGPMSLLCIRRTLARGWRHGMAIGGGIAIGDATYAMVAALGLAGISRFVLAYERPLHIVAGLFLIYLGSKAFWGRRTDDVADLRPSQGVLRDLAASVLLTLTNPPTIVMFAAIFTALAPSDGFAAGGAVAEVAGVFTGSLLWWCVVVALVTVFRHAIAIRTRTWLDRVAGFILVSFGLVELRRSVL